MQGETHYLLCIFRSKCDHGALSCDGSCHLIHLRPRQMVSRSSTHHPALKHTGPRPLTQKTTHTQRTTPTHTEDHTHLVNQLLDLPFEPRKVGFLGSLVQLKYMIWWHDKHPAHPMDPTPPTSPTSTIVGRTSSGNAMEWELITKYSARSS